MGNERVWPARARGERVCVDRIVSCWQIIRWYRSIICRIFPRSWIFDRHFSPAKLVGTFSNKKESPWAQVSVSSCLHLFPEVEALEQLAVKGKPLSVAGRSRSERKAATTRTRVHMNLQPKRQAGCARGQVVIGITTNLFCFDTCLTKDGMNAYA